MPKGKAIVTEIQVNGLYGAKSLEEACKIFMRLGCRTKIHFVIKLPDGEERHITIRDEDTETVAYGDFKGLPSMLDYAQALKDEGSL